MRVIKGDLLDFAMQGQFDVIIHGCNCHCRMGRGIAASIREQFPEAYDADCATPKGSREKLGSISLAVIIRDQIRFTVVNAYTQYNWGGEGVLADNEAIRQAFGVVKKRFMGLRIAYPRIGAGLARGDWATIAAIIDEQLAGENHTLVEFDPTLASTPKG